MQNVVGPVASVEQVQARDHIELAVGGPVVDADDPARGGTVQGRCGANQSEPPVPGNAFSCASPPLQSF